MVKLLGMVNCAPGFNNTPGVIDGCSELFIEVFGEAGRSARSAVGMAELPFDLSVEIEAIVQVRRLDGLVRLHVPPSVDGGAERASGLLRLEIIWNFANRSETSSRGPHRPIH